MSKPYYEQHEEQQIQSNLEKGFNDFLKGKVISEKKFKEKFKITKKKIVNENNLLFKDNHSLGCNLECYADVLRYRGFEKEADDIDRVASRIK